MKKSLILNIFAIIAFALPYSAVHAEVVVAGPTTAVTPTKPTPEVVPRETLTIKKAAAEKNLSAIYTQFTVFAGRTQSAIDRLSIKKVDTTKAQTELTITNTSLALTKTNLDILTSTVVTDDMTDTTALKANLKTIEDSLKDARAHLINSLTELKTAVVTTIDAQVQ